MEAAQVVNILLVDDREENLLALEAVLDSVHYKLVRANSGEQALLYLAHHDCAVILLDVQMPGIDGYETARRLRAMGHHHETPIIFLTAISRDDQYAQVGYQVGAVDFLVKPLDVPALRCKVAVFVELHLKTRKLLEQEKKLHQANLRMSEERLRTVINHASVLLWSINLEGVFTVCEGRGFREKNICPQDWEGRAVSDIFSVSSKVLENTHRALTGETFIAEVQFGLDWFEVHHAPLLSAEGEIIGMTGVATDVTSRKRGEIELQQAVQVREEFLSIASHELKTPLTPLRLQLQLLHRQARKDLGGVVANKDLLPKLEMAETQIIRLTNLIDDLLDISRMAHRKLAIYPEDMDLGVVVREVCSRFTEPARLAGSMLTMEGPASMPGRWDRMRIEQIMTNLVSNAIKYGARQPVNVLLELVGENDSAARITVCDHGIGISAEHHDRVFERFERAVPGSEFSGLGLGLYIVRQLVDAHDGSISVMSKLGVGSTFTVLLPYPSFSAAIAPGLARTSSRVSVRVEPGPPDQNTLKG